MRNNRDQRTSNMPKKMRTYLMGAMLTLGVAFAAQSVPTFAVEPVTDPAEPATVAQPVQPVQPVTTTPPETVAPTAAPTVATDAATLPVLPVVPDETTAVPTTAAPTTAAPTTAAPTTAAPTTAAPTTAVPTTAVPTTAAPTTATPTAAPTTAAPTTAAPTAVPTATPTTAANTTLATAPSTTAATAAQTTIPYATAPTTIFQAEGTQSNDNANSQQATTTQPTTTLATAPTTRLTTAPSSVTGTASASGDEEGTDWTFLIVIGIVFAVLVAGAFVLYRYVGFGFLTGFLNNRGHGNGSARSPHGGYLPMNKGHGHSRRQPEQEDFYEGDYGDYGDYDDLGEVALPPLPKTDSGRERERRRSRSHEEQPTDAIQGAAPMPATAMEAHGLETASAIAQGDRESQQDFCQVSHTYGGSIQEDVFAIGVLCDGMGEVGIGEQASYSACSMFYQDIFHTYPSRGFKALLSEEMQRIDNAIVNLRTHLNAQGVFGTTLVGTVIVNNEMNWVSIGDSRIYIFRSNQLHQLTRDHNYGMILDDQEAQGMITRRDARSHPNRSELISFLGNGEPEGFDVCDPAIELFDGDVIVLASDGLFTPLSSADIINILTTHQEDLQLAANTLVDTAVIEGGESQDNTSVVLIRYRAQ